MTKARFLSIEELPPRPDPKTGLPRPPHAPGFLNFEFSKESGFRELDPALAPSPPSGQGQVLVWFRTTQYGSVLTAGAIALLFLVYTVIQKGIGWLFERENLEVWAILAGIFVVFYWFFRRDRLSAGADWVARGKKWVRLYELTKVTSHSYPYWGAGVCLCDSGGRKLRCRFVDLSSDRLLWDLTYNGILHSVIAGGAETNWQARKTLALPEPPPKQP